MSKAKAILQRIVDGDNRGDFFISNELLKEIQELLAQPEQEQEPVAWIDDGCNGLIKQDTIRGYVMPLYTAQPKRGPLSDETIAKLWGESYSGTTQMVRNFARAIEQQHGIGVDDE